MIVEPVTLTGSHVRLAPLRAEDAVELCEHGLDPQLWRWTVASVRTESDMRDYVADALVQQERGTALPFVLRELGTDCAIGSTRFGNIDAANLRAEIGWTWVTAPWQRTAVNTEAKYLLLRHAFENWRCNRVELKTDALNDRSRAAIERLGAKQEGIFRRHMVTETGRLRDTVYYSIIREEWPEVRDGLMRRLGTMA